MGKYYGCVDINQSVGDIHKCNLSSNRRYELFTQLPVFILSEHQISRRFCYLGMKLPLHVSILMNTKKKSPTPNFSGQFLDIDADYLELGRNVIAYVDE